jgi:C-terminal processing protease CtpA/Prc
VAPVVRPPDEDDDKPEDPVEAKRRQRFERLVNHGFDKVERLDGNVGYLEMRGFLSPDIGGDTAAAAMTFVADTDALIVDLRRNGGGEPSMVALVSSYLFDAKPVHLNDLWWRKDGATHQFWTLPHVPGRRFGPEKPVFVLTSKRTFSAAEEFAYNLKTLKRATLVGETTGGGAHPGGPRRLTDHFFIWVPRGRAINPITRTNWEGTGVKPDVEVPAALALETAHLLALRDTLKRADDPEMKEDLQRAIREAETALERKKAAP